MSQGGTPGSGPNPKQNINMLTFPVIKYFDNQGPKIFRVLRKMMVSLFEHLGITTWKVIDQSWMFVEKFQKVPALIKSSNVVLSWKDMARDEAGYQWGLG